MIQLPVPRFGGGGGFGAGTVRIEQDSSVTQIIGFDSLPNGTTYQTKVGEAVPDYTVQLANDVRFKKLRLYFLWDRSHGGLMANLTQWLYDLDRNSRDYDDPTPDGRPLGLVRSIQYRKVIAGVQPEHFVFQAARGDALPRPAANGGAQTVGCRPLRPALRQRTQSPDIYPVSGDRSRTALATEQTPAARAPQELWAYPPSRSFWFSIDLGL